MWDVPHKITLERIFISFSFCETLHFIEIIISFSNIHSSFFRIYYTWNYSKLMLASYASFKLPRPLNVKVSEGKNYYEWIEGSEKWKKGGGSRKNKMFSWKIALLKVFIQHYWLTCFHFWIKKNFQINFFPLFHFKLNISSIIENHDGYIHSQSGYRVSGKQVQCWWWWFSQHKHYISFQHGANERKKNFLFLFFLISISSFMSRSPHFMLSFVFRWTKVNF